MNAHDVLRRMRRHHDWEQEGIECECPLCRDARAVLDQDQDHVRDLIVINEMLRTNGDICNTRKGFLTGIEADALARLAGRFTRGEQQPGPRGCQLEVTA
ncbi:MAG: hypothetical protein IT364_12940 [Candidatus Hydrogenedentes bacterium]|nr:hypothetical protein [Candidatus Hydrogenedentota bacterium]